MFSGLVVNGQKLGCCRRIRDASSIEYRYKTGILMLLCLDVMILYDIWLRIYIMCTYIYIYMYTFSLQHGHYLRRWSNNNPQPVLLIPRILSKNILGTFYLPQLVFCISETFLTLFHGPILVMVGTRKKVPWVLALWISIYLYRYFDLCGFATADPSKVQVQRPCCCGWSLQGRASLDIQSIDLSTSGAPGSSST